MFSSVIISAIAFLLALGILISIHEFGHFWVARKVGIKVLRYSIGFGKPLIKRRGRIDNTEFVVAAIPLGGYVKMLDEREGSVAPHERHRAFNSQPLWARSAVVIAGPLANFLLAIVAYWLVMMIGITGVTPLLGDPVPDSAADRAGFLYEDRIVSIDGKSVETWSDARIALIDSSIGITEPLSIGVITATGEQRIRSLPLSQSQVLQAQGDAVANLGFRTWWPDVKPIIGDVVAGGAADRAGLRIGDRIVSVDGVAVDTWYDLVAQVQPRGGDALVVAIERDGALERIELVPEATEVGGRSIGRIGVLETQSEAMAAEIAEKSQVVVRHPPHTAFFKALERTADISILTLRMLGKMLVGQASLDNISGPITIAQFAGQTASVGIDHYINFIALISISLAVLNLLPIPMLDGGHLMYFAAEAIRGQPLSERVQIWGQQVGIALLGGLMFLAFYNDIWRLVQ